MVLDVNPADAVENDSLPKDQRNKIQKQYKKYKWKRVPLQFVPGKKQYRIRVVVLTREEEQRQ